MSHEYHEITKEDIREATTEFCVKLNLSGGRAMQFDLYTLIECYITDLAAREKLNEVIKEKSYVIL